MQDWLESEEISAIRIVDTGWVENGNSNYTHHQKTATTIVAAVIKLAKENTTAAEQFTIIKDGNFIRCLSKKNTEQK